MAHGVSQSKCTVWRLTPFTVCACMDHHLLHTAQASSCQHIAAAPPQPCTAIHSNHVLSYGRPKVVWYTCVTQNCT